MGIESAPVYLFSKTPFEGVTHIPLLTATHFSPKIDFTAYDLLMITSKESVVALHAYGDAWKHIPAVAVSDATAKAVRESGGEVVDIAAGSGEELGALVMVGYRDRKILYPRAEAVASDFSETLRSEGVEVDEVVLYKTHCDTSVLPDKIEDDAVLVFTSPSSVTCFLRRHAIAPSHRIVAIGMTTRAALPAGVEVHLPEKPSVPAAVALAKHLARRE